MQRVAVAVLAMVASAACGNDDAPDRGWVARAAKAVAFLEWTRDGADVTGTLEISLLRGDEDGVLQVARDDHTIDGKIRDGQVTLNVRREGGGRARWTGRVRSDRIVLRYPTEERVPGTLRFSPATSDAYASAVERLDDAVHEYPRGSVKTFVTTCANEPDASREACKCVIERLQLTMPFAEFDRADRAAREKRALAPRAQRKLIEAADACR